MRFEVSYASGTRHQVQLARSLVVLGRDPGCDLVLNDTKISRRHAVIEDRPEGLLIRDCGSANGIQVNGARLPTAILRPGDTVRLGDVTLTLLVEVGQTVVIAPSDLEPLTVPSAGLPPALVAPLAAPVPSVPRDSAGPSPAQRPRSRPLTVGLLATLWAVSAPLAIALLLYSAVRLDAGPVAWAAAGAASLVIAGLAVAMVVGLRSLAPWARHLQMAIAAVGLLACPFTLAWATVLLYLGRPEVKAVFDRRPAPKAPTGSTAAEATFALSILGMILLGLVLSGLLVLLARPFR